jgi:hypothetical protein
MWKTLAAAVTYLSLGGPLVAGCGGKVVVDQGTGGGSGTTTATGTDCVSACDGTSPTCECQASCSTQVFTVGCSGGQCNCFENGIQVGACADDGSCVITASCCTDLFFGGG